MARIILPRCVYLTLWSTVFVSLGISCFCFGYQLGLDQYSLEKLCTDLVTEMEEQQTKMLPVPDEFLHYNESFTKLAMRYWNKLASTREFEISTTMKEGLLVAQPEDTACVDEMNDRYITVLFGHTLRLCFHQFQMGILDHVQIYFSFALLIISMCTMFFCTIYVSFYASDGQNEQGFNRRRG